jgi:VCBS repeat-containing protein
MKRLLVFFFCAVGVASISRAQLFSDDFTRVSDPGSLRSWTAFQGAWTVTNGVMLAGMNANASYGYAFTATNSFTNFSVQARIQLPAGAFAGGIGGRFTTNTGSHYAAWVYPEGSGGGALQFKLIRFSSYSSFNVLTNMALSSVGTNFHMVKLDMFGSQITATYDTNQSMTFTDSTYASGGISLEMYTDTTPYVMTVDDVLVPSTLPVAINDGYSMTAGTTLTVSAPGVLSNDGGGGGPLTAVQGVGPAHGTLSLSANGSFTYTPTNGYTGADTFTYRANDGVTNSALATVTITININHAPVANDESYSTLTNTPLIIAAPGVLANDTDADSNPLTAVQVVGPIHGTLSLNGNGSFTYTPTNNYSGGDTFTYRANDGLANSGIATASITVVPATNLFFDSFTRANDPTNLTAPWVVSSGSFTVTGGQLKSGTNPPSFGYSFAYITNRWTNYVVSALLPEAIFQG